MSTTLSCSINVKTHNSRFLKIQVFSCSSLLFKQPIPSEICFSFVFFFVEFVLLTIWKIN